MTASSFVMAAKSPCAGALPMRIGSVSLTEVEHGAITSVMPFAGKAGAVSEHLKQQVGAGLPDIGQFADHKSTRIAWTGQDQFMVLGAALTDVTGAALTDQSDAWCCVRIQGEDARDVLSRLVPADLRDTACPVGSALRSLLGHMNAIILHSDKDAYDVMVFRSMARTLLHDLKDAMETVAAR